MKSNILISFFLLIALPLTAQKNKTKQSGVPHFIEGIELNRNGFVATANPVDTNKNITPLKTSPIIENKVVEIIEDLGSLQIKYAQLLDVEIEKTSNKQLYEFIEDWVDTKYRFGGSTKSGIDCSGFSGMLFKEVYQKHLPRMASEQFKVCEKINKEELTEGDLVFFNTRGGVSHVGVYLMNDFFIHSSTKEGVVISSLNEDYYHRRFIGGGRFTSNNPDKIIQED